MALLYAKQTRNPRKLGKLTNASRRTANTWHFYYALVFVITVLCGKLVVALAAP
ncbi:DUF3265 domain-containing protein [Vibrio cincinnatiensis]|nr:DUF3265 domain-containing protein [Vibrio cincinnatiensis]MCG3741716.1 DUF3265 domain-containing protein [Vibrio cincinnatiensis]MCG3745230.1 DUF3265 domain-containing protein [Vibrio cincinnatiensis]MCG3767842.1 DUF3265 domain-containing protein [Vibrio cincinnatiensis]